MRGVVRTRSIAQVCAVHRAMTSRSLGLWKITKRSSHARTSSRARASSSETLLLFWVKVLPSNLPQ
ncbi:Uncharacterised protein [Mycobacteroides abscessus subsp. abscessus]|nr:Uncharacterised protein [Mycobacteroides abscessus subsp. abscessus]